MLFLGVRCVVRSNSIGNGASKISVADQYRENSKRKYVELVEISLKSLSSSPCQAFEGRSPVQEKELEKHNQTCEIGTHIEFSVLFSSTKCKKLQPSRLIC